MKLSKKILQILTIISIMPLFSINAYANDKEVTIDEVFHYEAGGLWHPGRVESKDFYINNHKENDISIDRLYISLKSSEYWKTGEKLDINSKQFKEFAKYSTVALKHDNEILFEDTFENLLSKDGIRLSKDIYIKSNSKELLNMTIDMDLEMNNDAQALNNVFTIGVAYKMQENIVQPSNPNKPGDEDLAPPNDSDNSLDINTDADGDISGKLPQTGGIINSASLMLLGAVAIGTGVVLNKKYKVEGGKHNE